MTLSGTDSARPSSSRPPHRVTSPMVLALTVAVVGVVADQASKFAALALLAHGTTVPALGGLVRLGVHRNTGAALGLGAGFPLVWSAAAVTALAAAWLVLPRVRTRWLALAWGLMVAGAAGNLADRTARGPTVGVGAVVDWVQVPWYPPWFNLADLLLRLGAVALLWSVVRAPARPPVSGPDPGAN